MDPPGVRRDERSRRVLTPEDRVELIDGEILTMTPQGRARAATMSGAPPLNRVRLPKPARLNVDIVELLLEERQGHR
jgi:virulence-associated protein VagC